MKTFVKLLVGGMALAGAAIGVAEPASAQPYYSFSFGVGPGYGPAPYRYVRPYRNPCFAPPYARPAFCGFPVYSGPVFIGGGWYRGPLHYRVYRGHREFWHGGRWQRGRW